MALIYTYPRLTTIANDDLFLVTDVDGSNTSVKPTKSVTLASIKQFIVGSVTIDYIPVSDGNSFVNSVMFQEPGTAYDTTKNVVVGGNIYQSGMSNSISIGKGALQNAVVQQGFPAENVAIGETALSTLEYGSNNIAIGKSTISNAVGTSGFSNVRNNIAISKESLLNLEVGYGNIALGYSSLSGLVNGIDNVSIGQSIGQFLSMSGPNTGQLSFNVILGARALGSSNVTTTGQGITGNVIIGEAASTNLTTTGFSRNIMIGNQAGSQLVGAPTDDIGIGYSAFFGSAAGFNSGGNNIAIGTNAQGNNALPGVEGSIKIGGDAGLAGSNAVNIGTVSQNIGQANDARGSHSALIGGYNNDVASQAGFIGAGHDNTVSSNATGGAILGGYNNIVQGTGSAGMALGSDLIVNGNNQVVVGRYNTATNNSKLIVGAGSSNVDRINVLDVKNSGQLQLGKYAKNPANFPAGNLIFNQIRLLGVSGVTGTGNVVEVEPNTLADFSQTIVPTSYDVSDGVTVNLPSTIGKLVIVTWNGANGNAILRLPDVAAFQNKYVQVLTDTSFDQGAALTNLKIETPFQSGQTIDGNPDFLINLAYRDATFWSDGTEYFTI